MIEAPETPRNPWSVIDLVVFGVFFGLTILFLPMGMIRVMRIFRPELAVSDLTAIDQVLLQGAMNVLLVAFIAFLVKVVHRRAFFDFIHWYRNHSFGTGFLIALGASLAVSVLVVSSFFPPSEPPPIEKLLSSPTAMYVFAIFGIGVATLFEEIIFRGFLFKVIFEIAGGPAAVFTTAFLFTVLHIPQLWGSWAGIALIFLVGYILSSVRDRTNSLIPPFIIHTAYNAMLFGLFAVSSFVQKSAG
ncbi:MAG: CPBP family intramembrane metalloprotease [Acidobacteria bacterium]|nr:CPBP family intramembrane metalloprotease [Acidobacteriota bacterium]